MRVFLFIKYTQKSDLWVSTLLCLQINEIYPRITISSRINSIILIKIKIIL